MWHAYCKKYHDLVKNQNWNRGGQSVFLELLSLDLEPLGELALTLQPVLAWQRLGKRVLFVLFEGRVDIVDVIWGSHGVFLSSWEEKSPLVAPSEFLDGWGRKSHISSVNLFLLFFHFLFLLLIRQLQTDLLALPSSERKLDLFPCFSFVIWTILLVLVRITG